MTPPTQPPPPACGGELFDDFGSIIPPKKGGNYTNWLLCYWIIYVTSHKCIEVKFVNDAEIETARTCSFDSITVSEIVFSISIKPLVHIQQSNI